MIVEVRLVVEGVAIRVESELVIEGAVADDACRTIVAEACDAAIGIGVDRYGIPPSTMGGRTHAVETEGRHWIDRQITQRGGRVVSWTVTRVEVVPT